MSGYDNEYSDLFDGEDRGRQSGKDLRAQLEQVLDQNRKLVERLESQERQETLTELFRSQGKDPAAVALVPKGVDPKEWLDKNGAFIADAKREAAEVENPEGTPAGEGQAAPEVSTDPKLEAERVQHEQMREAGGTGIPSTATSDPIEKMKSFDNKEDLLAYIQSQGGLS